jgi:flagellar hook-basal body complex protein FliE
MSIETIAALASAGATELAPAAASATPAAPAQGFGNWFATQLDQVNGTLAGAEADLRNLAAGRVDNLHQVMIHLEEAKLSFQLFAQVRNHLLEAYQEVMRTQV